MGTRGWLDKYGLAGRTFVLKIRWMKISEKQINTACLGRQKKNLEELGKIRVRGPARTLKIKEAASLIEGLGVSNKHSKTKEHIKPAAEQRLTWSLLPLNSKVPYLLGAQNQHGLSIQVGTSIRLATQG